MTRIGPGDQLLLLLQERLSTIGRTRGRDAAAATRREPGALDRARTLAALGGLDPDARRRAVVRGVLVQQLGDDIANDPAFAGIADDVTRILADDEAGRNLLDRALADLVRGN